MTTSEFLPLKPVDLIILLALVDEGRHGYGLALEVEKRTDGAARMEPGNLYRIIKRLLADELVAESGRHTAIDLDNERRRYYRITALGRRVVRAELARLRELMTSPSARRVLRRPEAT